MKSKLVLSRLLVGIVPVAVFVSGAFLGSLVPGLPASSAAIQEDQDGCEDDACVHVHRKFWFDSHYCAQTDGSGSGCDLDDEAEGGCASYHCHH